jgi:hypothetical protein
MVRVSALPRLGTAMVIQPYNNRYDPERLKFIIATSMLKRKKTGRFACRFPDLVKPPKPQFVQGTSPSFPVQQKPPLPPSSFSACHLDIDLLCVSGDTQVMLPGRRRDS